MHAIHPQLPRHVLMALLGAMLTLLVVLVLASRVGDVSLGSGSQSAAGNAAPAAVQTVRSAHAPAWLTNPFALPFQRVALPWQSRPNGR